MKPQVFETNPPGLLFGSIPSSTSHDSPTVMGHVGAYYTNSIYEIGGYSHDLHATFHTQCPLQASMFKISFITPSVIMLDALLAIPQSQDIPGLVLNFLFMHARLKRIRKKL